jgi:hypothetical protein
MSFDLAYMRQKLYLCEDFGWRVLGFASTGTRSATGVTDALRFGNNQEGEFQYADGWIRWPGLSSAEGRIKQSGALSGLTLVHEDGTNWAAPFTGTDYEWNPPGVHPDELDRCIQNVFPKAYVYNFLPQTPWRDGNFEAPDMDSWAGTNADLDKLTDQVYGKVGSQSLVVTNTAANGYAYNTVGIAVQPGQQLQLNARARNVQGGPISWRIYNFTGSVWGAELADAATGYGQTPVHLRHTITVPDEVYKINCRLGSPGNGDVTAWDALPGRDLAATAFDLESYNRDRFNITGVSEASYGVALRGGHNAYDGTTPTYEAWKRGRDFDTEHLAGNSNPNSVLLFREAQARSQNLELWYSSQRAWQEIDPLDDELAVTRAPEELVFHGAAANVAAMLNVGGADPYWTGVEAKHRALFEAQNQARAAVRLPEKRQRLGGRIGPR